MKIVNGIYHSCLNDKKTFYYSYTYFTFFKWNELPTPITESFTLITLETNVAIKNVIRRY